MAENIIGKIQRLLALAADGDGTSNEARVAAVTAARLIKEHGITIGPPEKASDRAVASIEEQVIRTFHPAWVALFRAIHPDRRADPVTFLAYVQWQSADLEKIAIKGKNLSDAKILRLNDLCAYHQWRLPITEDHPACRRLKQLQDAAIKRARAQAAISDTVRPPIVIKIHPPRRARDATIGTIIDSAVDFFRVKGE